MKVYQPEELQPEAKRLFHESPLTQQQLAKALGVSQSSISRALTVGEAERQGKESFYGLRARIIEHLTGEAVQGPVWVQESKA